MRLQQRGLQTQFADRFLGSEEALARVLQRFGEYFRLVSSGSEPGELQTMVDLLTTNETYFFREEAHFDFLKDVILADHRAD